MFLFQVKNKKNIFAQLSVVIILNNYKKDTSIEGSQSGGVGNMLACGLKEQWCKLRQWCKASNKHKYFIFSPLML